MKWVVVSVFDSAVGTYMRPFVAPSRNAAQRSFADEVNRVGSEMHAHPGDYVLWQLSIWDDESGLFVDGKEPSSIVRAADVLKEVRDV